MSIKITSVKETADRSAPTVSTGYLVNGEHSVPRDQRNPYYRAVRAWIKAGNTPDPAFTPAELAEIAAEEAAEADRAAIRADAQVRTLVTSSVADIEAYVDANVTSINDVKAMLKLLAKALSLVARGQFQG